MKKLFCLVIVVASLAPVRAAHAGPIGSGQTLIPSVAIQDITLLPGTPFNPMGTDVFLPGVSGRGILALNRASQVGSTIAIPSLTGVYFGSYPGLGNYRFGTITPAGQAEFSGSIMNVVQDPSDPGFASGDPSSFVSGDYEVSGDFFEFELLESGAFFTTEGVTFNSFFDGLPPSPGTILDGGDDRVDIFLGGNVVAFSTNRRIITGSVPEPTSGLLMAGLLGAASLVRCRRSK